MIPRYTARCVLQCWMKYNCTCVCVCVCSGFCFCCSKCCYYFQWFISWWISRLNSMKYYVVISLRQSLPSKKKLALFKLCCESCINMLFAWKKIFLTLIYNLKMCIRNKIYQLRNIICIWWCTIKFTTW